MLPFIARRIALFVPTLLGVSVVIFGLLYLVPGDPLSSLLPPDASQEQRDRVAHALGFDQPVPIQYLQWLGRVAHGDFGTSLARNRPVGAMLGEAVANTMVLAAAAGVLALVLGLALGTLAAVRHGTLTDRLVRVVSVTGVSVPSYWAVLLLITVFAVQLHWLPASGMRSVTGDGGPGDLLAHLVLPALAASMVTLGLMARMVRTSVLDVLNQDYVLTLRAKGMGAAAILAHTLKNAAPPIMTVGGLQIGHLLAGSVLVETVCGWPGVGQLIYQSISQRDVPVTQGGVLAVALVFVVLNLIVDLLHGVVDPRIRQASH
ncbi:MAG TPA: ABC transporter permease [Chloroflexota bacterium]|jgi:peptide/nickel transport system permease protein